MAVRNIAELFSKICCFYSFRYWSKSIHFHPFHFQSFSYKRLRHYL